MNKKTTRTPKNVSPAKPKPKPKPKQSRWSMLNPFGKIGKALK